MTDASERERQEHPLDIIDGMILEMVRDDALKLQRARTALDRMLRADAQYIAAQSAELDRVRKALELIKPFAYHYTACGLRTGLGFECSCGKNVAVQIADEALAAQSSA